MTERPGWDRHRCQTTPIPTCAATEDSPKIGVTTVLTGPAPAGMTCGDAVLYTLKRNLSPMVEVRWQLWACGL
jgi:hypothetical protein